jgi:hypothetical protein
MILISDPRVGRIANQPRPEYVMLRTPGVAGVAIRSNRHRLSATTRHNLPQAEVLSQERHRKTHLSP